jgi:hypothetical protein
MFAGASITAADAAAVLIRCVENGDIDRVRRRHPPGVLGRTGLRHAMRVDATQRGACHGGEAAGSGVAGSGCAHMVKQAAAALQTHFPPGDAALRPPSTRDSQRPSTRVEGTCAGMTSRVSTAVVAGRRRSSSDGSWSRSMAG